MSAELIAAILLAVAKIPDLVKIIIDLASAPTPPTLAEVTARIKALQDASATMDKEENSLTPATIPIVTEIKTT